MRRHPQSRLGLLALVTLILTTVMAAACQGDVYSQQRTRMVALHLARRDISDSVVLGVMGRVPRHLFVPAGQRPFAYEDRPLAIGEGQTISQPYIVAYMTQALGLEAGDRVLEIGTGVGVSGGGSGRDCQTGVHDRDRAATGPEGGGGVGASGV